MTRVCFSAEGKSTVSENEVMKQAIYYDTETTGVRVDKDRIIEIAAYDPAQDRSFVSFVNPGMRIPPESTAICQITDEMVKEAPSFETVGQAFIDFCGPNAILIAHNNDSFDKPLLQNELARCNITMPQWEFVDSLKWARKYRTDLPRHSLQVLREAYGIPANQAHRALDDVMVLHQIFSQMIDDLPIQKVVELLAQSKATTRMPFGKYQGKPLSEIPKDYVKWLKTSGAFDRSDNAELRTTFEKLGLL